MTLPPGVVESVLNLAVEIQQIPAPTFDEGKRAHYIKELFAAETLQDIELDPVGNVYARLPGNSLAPPLIVSAHLDTVFPITTDLTPHRTEERIYGPGIGDNSTGVAGLFGLLWALKAQEITLPGDLWLVANVCEEGMGDLVGMRAVMDRFGGNVRAYIILEGMALGQVYYRGLNVERYRLTVNTPGGHSWVDYGHPSAIHILANVINQLVQFNLPSKPRTTLNVGTIQGGVSINTIAPSAALELDLRSESPTTLAAQVRRLKTLVESYRQPEVQLKLEQIGLRPGGALPTNHWLVRLAQESLHKQGLQPVFNIGSTDANIPLSRGYPAVCIGMTTGSGAHTCGEYILTRPLAAGLHQLVEIVSHAYEFH